MDVWVVIDYGDDSCQFQRACKTEAIAEVVKKELVEDGSDKREIAIYQIEVEEA